MSGALLDKLGLAGDARIRPGAKPGQAMTAVPVNPATGEALSAGVALDDAGVVDATIAGAAETFKTWREVPAPVRGQVVRAIADEFRRAKPALAEIISLETGKIRAEALGEVQETIDIADFAVGLSRQLHGITMPSERPGHRMYEQWVPMGPIGVISAFNFPNAVWAWNAMLAAVCGDTVVWKPSLLTPLTSLATNRIAESVASTMGYPGVFRLAMAADDGVAERLVKDRRLPLISATGSCRMGRRVGELVAGRLGKCLLELGGNNALIVHEDADLALAVPAVVFGSVGTAGQRCTTTRRLIVHERIADQLVQRLVSAYTQIIGDAGGRDASGKGGGTTRLGDPLKEGTLVGPLVTPRAVEAYLSAVARAKAEGGEVLVGGAKANLGGTLSKGNYVLPTIVRAPRSNVLPVAMEETFAPILYVFTYKNLDEAIGLHNSVDQGLSSAIFTESVRVANRFTSPAGSGSDCGIANVNLGTSGAEIGGAFGGEKDTGGGRESGSDSWKAYMRRQTCTVNFGGKFELAQGIRFE